MGCAMSGMQDDLNKYMNWRDNLSGGELELVKMRKELLQMTDDFAFKRDQMKEIDKICSKILEITGGQSFNYELDK